MKEQSYKRTFNSPLLIDKEEEQSSMISNMDDEREFEEFIIRSTNSVIDNEIENTQNQIVTIVRPLFNKLKQKEDNITDVMTKAKGFSDYYQKSNETLAEDTMRIKERRNKLKLVCKELGDLKQRLLKREAELAKFDAQNKENEELLKENEEIQRNNTIKLQKYIEEKSHELTMTANEINRLKEENEAKDKELMLKEGEIALREDKMSLIEKELKERNQKLIDFRDQIIYKSNNNNNSYNNTNNYNIITTNQHMKNFSLGGNDLNANDNNNEYNDTYCPFETNSKKNILNYQNQYGSEMHYTNNYLLHRQIEERRAELETLNQKYLQLSNELHTKELDLSNRLEIVDNRERELNLQKEELYKKLHEVEKKLEETKLLTIELKQKEGYINNYSLNEKYLLKVDMNS